MRSASRAPGVRQLGPGPVRSPKRGRCSQRAPSPSRSSAAVSSPPASPARLGFQNPTASEEARSVHHLLDSRRLLLGKQYYSLLRLSKRVVREVWRHLPKVSGSLATELGAKVFFFFCCQSLVGGANSDAFRGQANNVSQTGNRRWKRRQKWTPKGVQIQITKHRVSHKRL